MVFIEFEPNPPLNAEERLHSFSKAHGRHFGIVYSKGEYSDLGYGADFEQAGARGQSRREGQRGKGPKNYQRSDEIVGESLYHLLTLHEHLDASAIDFTVQNAEVVLMGLVDSRHERWLAADLAASVPGVRGVSNLLNLRNRQFRNR